MRENTFWWVILCVLLITAFTAGWNLPLRIAVAANAIVLLIDTAKQAKELWQRYKQSEAE